MLQNLVLKTISYVVDEAAIGLIRMGREPSVRPDFEENYEQYASLNVLKKPGVFFPPPAELPVLDRTRFKKVESNRHRELMDFSFPTPLPSAHPENNTVYGRYYIPRGQPLAAPTIIYVPPWQTWTYHFFQKPCLELVDRGFNVIFLQTPYHMARAPKGTYSGELVLTLNLKHTIETFRQAVCELRAVVGALEAAGVERVAVFGTSLGGQIAALATAAEPKLAASILNIPACDPWMQLRRTKVGQLVARDYVPSPSELKSVRRAVRVITPRLYRPAIPPENILILAADFDQFVPREAIDRLYAAWKGSQLHEFPHGHITINHFSARFYETIARFLEDRMR